MLALASGTAHAQNDRRQAGQRRPRHGRSDEPQPRAADLLTDDAGTIYFEWDNVVALVSTTQFDVTTSDGRRFRHAIRGTARTLVVNEAGGQVSLPMTDVTVIMPIGSSFWAKLDGSLDFGFSYTRSSHIAQLTITRRRCTQARVRGCASPRGRGH